MKTIKYLLLTVILTMSLPSLAQSGKPLLTITDQDTTFYIKRSGIWFRYDGETAVKKYADFKKQNPKGWSWDAGHWQGGTIHYSGLVGGLGNLNTPEGASWLTQGVKSIGVDLNLIDVTIFSKGCFGIISGLGLEINNFRFDKNVALGNDESGRVAPNWSYREAGISLSKSKLTTTYLQVPLLFEFQFGKRDNGWVNFGVVGGFLLQAHTKVKSEERGIEKKYRDLNLNNFHYGFEVAAGYSAFGLRAKYYPQSIFRPGEGPNVQQVNIGLTIAF